MSFYLLAAGSLFLAGLVKGVFGMGLPAVSLGLLSLLIAPVEAATLIVIPTLTTNAWQFFSGPRRRELLRRFATLLVGVAIGTVFGIRALTQWDSAAVSLTLGIVLLIYAVVGVFAAQWTIQPPAQRWTSPLIGFVTGLVNGATGVSVMPLIPYLNSIGLQRDELIQAMGLVFMTAIVALAACLAWTGHLQVASAGASALAIVPVFAGMYAGQSIRLQLKANDFRRWFFVGLFALGGYCVARALIQM